MSTKYEKCQKKKMNEVMYEFKKGKLKTRSNNKVKSRQQAIAIGLSMSNNVCQLKINKSDYIKMEEKIKNNIQSNKKVSLTSIKNGLKLIKHYEENRNYKKANEITQLLFIKVLKSIQNNEKINQSIISDLLSYMNK
jgi:hypothetical protein